MPSLEREGEAAFEGVVGRPGPNHHRFDLDGLHDERDLLSDLHIAEVVADAASVAAAVNQFALDPGGNEGRVLVEKDRHPAGRRMAKFTARGALHGFADQ